jgi:hypothetical protein
MTKINIKKLEIKNWTSSIQDPIIIGSYMLRRPKHSMIEVILQEEEEEEEEEGGGGEEEEEKKEKEEEK